MTEFSLLFQMTLSWIKRLFGCFLTSCKALKYLIVPLIRLESTGRCDTRYHSVTGSSLDHLFPVPRGSYDELLYEE